jgi:hypothetical protein
MAENPYLKNRPIFGSPEWQKQCDEEVASRPTALLVRKPFTAEDWDKLIDLFNKSTEQAALATRNTINNNDGITIRFLVSVPGHSAGEVATISTARAHEYLAEKQAEIAG